MPRRKQNDDNSHLPSFIYNMKDSPERKEYLQYLVDGLDARRETADFQHLISEWDEDYEIDGDDDGEDYTEQDDDIPDYEDDADALDDSTSWDDDDADSIDDDDDEDDGLDELDLD